jgi:hypothetical protein
LHVSEGGCDVKASKHLASLPTTDWNVSGKQVAQPSLSVFTSQHIRYTHFLNALVQTANKMGFKKIIFILCFRVANSLFANSQNTRPHFITGMTCKCILLFSFCKPTFFRGYPRVRRTVLCKADMN